MLSLWIASFCKTKDCFCALVLLTFVEPCFEGFFTAEYFGRASVQVDADEEVVEAFGLGVDVVNVELADVGEAHCAYVLDEGEVCCFHDVSPVKVQQRTPMLLRALG